MTNALVAARVVVVRWYQNEITGNDARCHERPADDQQQEVAVISSSIEKAKKFRYEKKRV